MKKFFLGLHWVQLWVILFVINIWSMETFATKCGDLTLVSNSHGDRRDPNFEDAVVREDKILASARKKRFREARQLFSSTFGTTAKRIFSLAENRQLISQDDARLSDWVKRNGGLCGQTCAAIIFLAFSEAGMSPLEVVLQTVDSIDKQREINSGISAKDVELFFSSSLIGQKVKVSLDQPEDLEDFLKVRADLRMIGTYLNGGSWEKAMDQHWFILIAVNEVENMALLIDPRWPNDVYIASVSEGTGVRLFDGRLSGRFIHVIDQVSFSLD